MEKNMDNKLKMGLTLNRKPITVSRGLPPSKGFFHPHSKDYIGSFPVTATVTTMGYRSYKNPLNKAPLRTVTGRGNAPKILILGGVCWFPCLLLELLSR